VSINPSAVTRAPYAALPDWLARKLCLQVMTECQRERTQAASWKPSNLTLLGTGDAQCTRGRSGGVAVQQNALGRPSDGRTCTTPDESGGNGDIDEHRRCRSRARLRKVRGRSASVPDRQSPICRLITSAPRPRATAI